MSHYIREGGEITKEVEVRTFVVKLYCQQCGSEMRFDGMVLTSNPPWYPHSCTNRECGWGANFRSRYPKTITKVIDESDELF